MGVVATIKLSKNWTVQVGLTAGNDTAVWGPDARRSPLACIQWTRMATPIRSMAAPTRSMAPGGTSLPIGCAPIPGNTQECAIVNYTNWQVTPRDSLTLRNEYMDDENGPRTGTATHYYGVA